MTKTQPEPGYVQVVTPRLDHAPSRGSGHARCLRDPVLSAGSCPSSFCFTTPHGECVYGRGEGGHVAPNHCTRKSSLAWEPQHLACFQAH